MNFKLEVMIAELCRQLLAELKTSKSPLLSYLQPGISKEVVDDTLRKANLDIVFPDEVYSLYGWKNGINEDESELKDLGELSLFQLGIFTSLNLSMNSYLGWAVQKGYWSQGLFPLFESGGGDYYLIDTNSKSTTYKMILLYSPSNPYIRHAVSIFDSLDSWLTSVIECYRQKAYFFDSDSSYLEIDPKIQNAIWRKNNPNSEYFRILENYK